MKFTEDEIRRRFEAAREAAGYDNQWQWERVTEEGRAFYRHLLESADKPLPDPVDEAFDKWVKSQMVRPVAFVEEVQKTAFRAGAEWQRDQGK